MNFFFFSFLCLFVSVSSFSGDGLFRMNEWMNEWALLWRCDDWRGRGRGR